MVCGKFVTCELKEATSPVLFDLSEFELFNDIGK